MVLLMTPQIKSVSRNKENNPNDMFSVRRDILKKAKILCLWPRRRSSKDDLGSIYLEPPRITQII